jgi:hypothetical protein
MKVVFTARHCIRRILHIPLSAISTYVKKQATIEVIACGKNVAGKAYRLLRGKI